MIKGEKTDSFEDRLVQLLKVRFDQYKGTLQDLVLAAFPPPEETPDIIQYAKNKSKPIKAMLDRRTNRPRSATYLPICDALGITKAEIAALRHPEASHQSSVICSPQLVLAEIRQKGITEGVINSFLVTLGQQQVPLEKLPETLHEIAEHHLAYKQELAKIKANDSENKERWEQALQAVDQGDYKRAEALIEAYDAAEAQAEAIAREDLRKRGLHRATAQALFGKSAMAQLQSQKAAALFERAAQLVPDGNDDRRALYQLWQANALQDWGEHKGVRSALESAVNLYHSLLSYYTRERVPLDWAGIQYNLCTALTTMGRWDSDTVHLDAAVMACRLVLEEWTRVRVPLDWAMTQNNLGNALMALGGRESGTANLEAAVTAYRQALEERTRERVPLDWAGTQHNLGNALTTLGERETGTAQLEAAVTAYRQALEERTRERAPLDWAKTQDGLGNVLTALGERESGTANLEAAVTAYHHALEERTRERVPLDWAKTQNNLCTALTALGERESGTAHLEAAVAACRLALEEITRERMPLDWASTQTNLGGSLQVLGWRETVAHQKAMFYQEALACYTNARVVLVEEAGMTQYRTRLDLMISQLHRLIKQISADN